MCIALSLLGVYSASMYKIASDQRVRTHIVDMPLTSSADMERILEVVKPKGNTNLPRSNYLPGVACVIDAGPNTSVEMMEQVLSRCISDRNDFMDPNPFVE